MTKQKPASPQKIVDTTRRHLLTIAAGGAVAAAISADARAYPGHAADPIFAAIDAHRASVETTDRLLELAELRGMSADLYSVVHDSLRSERKTAKALTGTAPTTRAGLRALEEYLRRNDYLSLAIERTATTDDGYTYKHSGGPEGVDWLIAKRAAEIGAVRS
jgi:hypothetical protein